MADLLPVAEQTSTNSESPCLESMACEIAGASMLSNIAKQAMRAMKRLFFLNIFMRVQY